MLPIKGSNVKKTDNPLIITSANHNIKELVLRKWGMRCCCIEVPQGELCGDVSTDSGRPALTIDGCSVSQFANSFYKALMARLIEVKVEAPFFPKNESEYDEVWKQYIKAIRTRPYEDPPIED